MSISNDQSLCKPVPDWKKEGRGKVTARNRSMNADENRDTSEDSKLR